MARTRQTARKSTGGKANQKVIKKQEEMATAVVDTTTGHENFQLNNQAAAFMRDNGAVMMSPVWSGIIDGATKAVYVPSDYMTYHLDSSILGLTAPRSFTEFGELAEIFTHHLGVEDFKTKSGKTLIKKENTLLDGDVQIPIVAETKIGDLNIYIINGFLSDEELIKKLKAWALELTGSAAEEPATSSNWKFISSRALTIADVKSEQYKLEDVDIDDLALEGYINDEEEEAEINEALIESGYIIGELMIDGEKYTLIHGFPGDNPVGVFIDAEGKKTFVGEAIDTDFDVRPSVWYEETTDKSNFDNQFWHPRPIEAIQEDDQE